MIRFASFTFSSFLFIPFAVLSLLYFFLYGAPGRLTAFRSIRQTFIRYAHKFRQRKQEKRLQSITLMQTHFITALGVCLQNCKVANAANTTMPPFSNPSFVPFLSVTSLASPTRKTPDSKNWTIMAANTWTMEQSFKTFADLVWFKFKERDDAEINFDNGWGLHVYSQGTWHDGTPRYQVWLLQEGEEFLGHKPEELIFPVWKSTDDVTGCMRWVQELPRLEKVIFNPAIGTASTFLKKVEGTYQIVNTYKY